MTKNQLITQDNELMANNRIDDAINQLNKNAKTILFIEPYGSALSLLNRGIVNGYNIIVLTANSDLRMVPDHIINAAHIAIQVDTMNEFQILSLLQKKFINVAIDAVIPGFEYFVPVAAKVCDYLKLLGIELADVMNLRNKALMRASLSQANVPVPKFVVVNTMNDLDKAIETIGFPGVCKPIDAAGSVNVKKVNNKSDAIQTANHILNGQYTLWGHRLANTLLYEEYIAGKEYSVEGTVTNGKTVYYSITEKFVSDEYEFIEIGHVVNPPLDAHLLNRIENYIDKVITVLRPNNCPFHAEIRINRDGQPILMEIAARLAGDKIGDLINLARNINYFDYVYYSYFGDFRQPLSMQNMSAGIRFFYREKIDKYSEITGMSEVNSYPIEEVCFYYQANEHIPAFPKALRRLGHVIMKGNDYEQMTKTLQLIDDNIHFHP